MADLEWKYRLSLVKGLRRRRKSDMMSRNKNNNVTNDNDIGNGVWGTIITFLSLFLLAITLPFSLCAMIKTVQEYERAVIFRLGRIRKGRAVGPGLFVVMPCIDDVKVVDLRVFSFDVPPQEIVSKDSVTMRVDAVVYYHVQDPLAACVNVVDSGHSTRLLATTTLCKVLGTKNMSEILADRDGAGGAMHQILDAATHPWGIKVDRVEVKDMRLPEHLQRAMAAEAEASREARAMVIAAEGEHKASLALKEASDIISMSPAALQLRYLQTLSNISAENNSTIIFPLPIELISKSLIGNRRE